MQKHLFWHGAQSAASVDAAWGAASEDAAWGATGGNVAPNAVSESETQDRPWEGVCLIDTGGGQTVELIAALSVPAAEAAWEAAFPARGGGTVLLDATRLCAETVMQAEERLLAHYLRAARAAEGRHLILRAPLPEGRERTNGLHALLERPAFLSAHLLAALRVTPYCRVSLLFPFVCTVSEIDALRRLTEQAMRTLRERGQPFDELVELGVELATPAAALLSRTLISEVDLAVIDVDRLAALALALPGGTSPFPDLPPEGAKAVLFLIEAAVENTHFAGRRVALCGRVWESPALLPRLLAMGVDALVVPPRRLDEVRDRIRALP